MTSRRTYLSQHWLSNWLALSSPNCFKTVQPNLSRAHQTPSSTSTNWMHTPYASSTIFSLEDQMFIEIIILHLYVKSILQLYVNFNSSPRREVQFFTSMWSPNQLLENPNTPNSFIWAASPNGWAFTASYVPCPRDEANCSSLKWASLSSSTYDWIYSNEPN